MEFSLIHVRLATSRWMFLSCRRILLTLFLFSASFSSANASASADSPILPEIHRMPEYWIEVNITPRLLRDEALLVNFVGPLIHNRFRDRIETWFFFWEPDLRLRIRWRDGGDTARCESELFAILDTWCKQGVHQGMIQGWFDGAHGKRAERYVGEAEFYGPSLWPIIQKDWMQGSEFALSVAELDARGQLPKDRNFYWSRHVHLYTNQLYGSWDSEISLTLQQALGYLRLMQQAEQGRDNLARDRIIDEISRYLSNPK